MKKKDIDIIPAIPTTYNGIKFRSRLEATWAAWFDDYLIKWSYELEGFDFDGVWYLPDFHLPEINTFMEIKGALQGIPKARKFYDVLMKISSGDWWWDPQYQYFLGGSPVPSFYNIHDNEDYWLFRCKKCGKYWIALASGSYVCRVCGEYDGDHHLGSREQLPQLFKPLEWDPPKPEIKVEKYTDKSNISEFMK